MLSVDFDVWQDNPSDVVLKDTTPAYSFDETGGYGIESIEPQDIIFSTVTFTFPDRKRVQIQKPYTQLDGEWRININDLSRGFITYPSVGDCQSCHNAPTYDSSLKEFPSGCYQIEYEVFTNGVKRVEVADYFISAFVSATDKVYVWVDGIQEDITSNGNVDDKGIFQWTDLQTKHEYTLFKVIASDGSELISDNVLKVGSNTFDIVHTNKPVSASKKIKSFVLWYSIEKKYHDHIFAYIVPNKKHYDFHYDRHKDHDNICELVMAKSKIDMLKQSQQTNCEWVTDTINRLNVLLT